MFSFINILDIIGTIAFAISGIRLASAKKFDWFGAYVVGLITAVGGGTLRDICLGATPFWMTQPSYIIWTGFSLLYVIFFGKLLIKQNNTFFTFDTIGLALFVVVGIEKTLAYGFPMWVAIIMGTFTGAAGGIMRDILINEIPLVFRKDVYAMACVFGGLVYYFGLLLGLEETLTQCLSAAGTIGIRIIAVKYHISIPAFKGEEEEDNLEKS